MIVSIDDRGVVHQPVCHSIKEFTTMYNTFQTHTFFHTNINDICVKRIPTFQRDNKGRLVYYKNNEEVKSTVKGAEKIYIRKSSN